MENVEKIELNSLADNPLKATAKKISDYNLKMNGRYSCTVEGKKRLYTIKDWIKEVA